MSEIAIGLIMIFGFFTFFVIAVVVLTVRWALKINTQLYYQKLIYEQLVNLNNIFAEKWQTYNKT